MGTWKVLVIERPGARMLGVSLHADHTEGFHIQWKAFYSTRKCAHFWFYNMGGFSSLKKLLLKGLWKKKYFSTIRKNGKQNTEMTARSLHQVPLRRDSRAVSMRRVGSESLSRTQTSKLRPLLPWAEMRPMVATSSRFPRVVANLAVKFQFQISD